VHGKIKILVTAQRANFSNIGQDDFERRDLKSRANMVKLY